MSAILAFPQVSQVAPQFRDPTIEALEARFRAEFARMADPLNQHGALEFYRSPEDTLIDGWRAQIIAAAALLLAGGNWQAAFENAVRGAEQQYIDEHTGRAWDRILDESGVD